MKERRNLIAPATATTRRRLLSRVAIAVGGLSMDSPKLWAQAAEEISHAAESIYQETVINASRERVYDALTDAKQFNEVTKIAAAKDPAVSLEKAPTVISRDVGGAFSLFGGIILGRHHRTGAQHAHRTGLASELLESGCVLNREIRAHPARQWN